MKTPIRPSCEEDSASPRPSVALRFLVGFFAVLSDFRYALRQLRKAPGFSVVAILTLALCIGANSAIFSVVNGILLKPYPWPESERLIYLFNAYPRIGLENAGTSIPDYLDRREGVNGLADSALYYSNSFNLAATGQPERVAGIRATPSLFSTLKTSALLGRTFTEEEAKPGNDRVVVLSHALWKNRFGGDPAIVGTTLHLNAEPVTVLGVMPAGFYFPDPNVQVWVPFTFTAEQMSENERGTEFSTMIGRLKPGFTLEEVRRNLDLIQRRNAERFSSLREFWNSAGFGGRASGFLEQNVADVRGMLWLVQAGVAAALLIGCANVASLLLARAMARETELAIRVSLGAGRSRLVRMLLTESVVLFLAGGLLGLLVALWSIEALGTMGLDTLPRGFEVRLDFSVFVFTLLCALVTGTLFGALPAWSATQGNAAASLKEAGARLTGGRRTQRLRAALVMVEIALAVMLLSTAGLLVKSFSRLQQQSPGFTPGGVITALVDLPLAKYDRPEKLVAFRDSVVAKLGAIPGVTDAGLTTVLPFTGNNSQRTYTSPDIVLPPGAPLPHAQIREVDPGYLRTLGLTLLQGRWFTESDIAAGQKVCVIDRFLADRYWAGQDPVGKRIKRDPDLYLVVGMVAAVKSRNLEENVSKETIYYPFSQLPSSRVALVVKTGGDPGALAGQVRAAVWAVDREQAVFDIKTMAKRMEDTAQPRRGPMLLLSLFSGVALLLAALGVYGVLAYSVAQRRSEFGLRLALGATARDIVGLVVRQGMALIGVGIAAGFLGYLVLNRVIAQLLYGISSADPTALALAPLILALVGLAACFLPAQRAGKVDPMTSLRGT